MEVQGQQRSGVGHGSGRQRQRARVECRLSHAVHGYPMEDYPKGGNTFFTTVERDGSGESQGDVNVLEAAARGEGITNTTTTAMSFLTR